MGTERNNFVKVTSCRGRNVGGGYGIEPEFHILQAVLIQVKGKRGRVGVGCAVRPYKNRTRGRLFLRSIVAAGIKRIPVAGFRAEKQTKGKQQAKRECEVSDVHCPVVKS